MECTIQVLCKNYLQTTFCWPKQIRISQNYAKASRWVVVGSSWIRVCSTAPEKTVFMLVLD